MGHLPEQLDWLFWDVDPRTLDLDSHQDFLLPRILEHGGLADVRWAIDRYGLDGIHRFLRDVGHPELSARTLAFWRAVLHAENEAWVRLPDWRKSKSVPWDA